MIKDFDKRKDFWDKSFKIENQGGSVQDPFKRIDGWENVFKGKSVLEVGPGEKRQFKTIHPLAQSYSVCDISQSVLNLYPDIKTYLIEDYKADNLGKFDVITFWYVIHHILKNEAHEFFMFLSDHIIKQGKLFFNIPHFNSNEIVDWSGDDGIKTTRWNFREIVDLLNENKFFVKDTKYLSNNCMVILAEKEIEIR